MPRYNTHLIVGRRSYSLTDVRALFGINRQTWSRWIGEGMVVIEKNTNPLLVMGSDLVTFLEKRKAKQRKSLGPNDFYCVRCHIVVRAQVGTEKIEKTGKKIGRNSEDQMRKTGQCDNCGKVVYRFLGVNKQD